MPEKTCSLFLLNRRQKNRGEAARLLFVNLSDKNADHHKRTRDETLRFGDSMAARAHKSCRTAKILACLANVQLTQY